MARSTTQRKRMTAIAAIVAMGMLSGMVLGGAWGRYSKELSPMATDGQRRLHQFDPGLASMISWATVGVLAGGAFGFLGAVLYANHKPAPAKRGREKSTSGPE